MKQVINMQFYTLTVTAGAQRSTVTRESACNFLTTRVNVNRLQ